MAKKTQRSKRTVGNSRRAQRGKQVDELIVFLSIFILERQWPEAIDYAQKLLNSFSLQPELRVDVLGSLGTAYMELHDYPQAYKAFSEALSIKPEDIYVLYCHNIAAQHTNRFGQAMRDLEVAAEHLGTDSKDKLAHRIQKDLKRRRKATQRMLKKRGTNFTLDQLIEQEELYQQALEQTRIYEWAEAERLFRRVIEMAEKDFDPRPWNNLGLCLVMQQRYDEAEAAWRRSLKIDRFYWLARNHLRLLPEIRRTGDIALGHYGEVYEGDKVKKKLTVDEKK